MGTEEEMQDTKEWKIGYVLGILKALAILRPDLKDQIQKAIGYLEEL